MTTRSHKNVAPLTEQEHGVVDALRKREAARIRTCVTLALPVLMLTSIALGSTMTIESIYIVAGGAVVGLLTWTALLNFMPLSEGGLLHTLVIASNRSAEEEQLMLRWRAYVEKSDCSASD